MRRKRLWMTVISVLMIITCFLLSSCSKEGASQATEDVPFEEERSSLIDTSVTFKEAIEWSDEPQIWYLISDIDGRYSNIQAALVFENGKVKVYNPFYGGLDLNPFGTLEEYYDLSTEEAIDMLQSRYESAYRTYYELFNKTNEFYDPDGTRLACYNELLNYKIEIRPEEEYYLKFFMDETGNNIDSEAFFTKYTQEKRPMDRTDESEVFEGIDYYIPESHEEWNRMIGVSFKEQTGPIEVYDSYFNGYSVIAGEGMADHPNTMMDMHVSAMVTKCGYDAQFEIDERGTEGIEEAY